VNKFLETMAGSKASGSHEWQPPAVPADMRGSPEHTDEKTGEEHGDEEGHRDEEDGQGPDRDGWHL